MKRKQSAFPGIPRQRTTNPTENAITENIEVLTGARGNNRALLISDLISLDAMKRKAIISNISGNGSNGSLPGDVDITIEKPHAPQNVNGVGGFTFIAITWDKPTYRGHAFAEIYRSDTDAFNSSVKIATEVSDVFSDSVEMGSSYYYWVRFVNKVDIKGPIQSAAGIFVQTKDSAETILGAIGGLIEESHLGPFLSSKVGDLFDDMYDAQGLINLTKIDLDAVIADTEALSIDLVSNYYNKTGTDSAISLATTNLKSAIENPSGGSVGAVLNNFYYTSAAVDAAIAAAGVALKAEIENPEGGGIEADFILNYLTKVDTLKAISLSVNQLSANFESLANTAMENALANDLVEEKRRITSANIIKVQEVAATEAEATAQDVLQLFSDVDGVSANLQNNYYTKVTADYAISQATTTLRSTIENPNGSSVGASLQQLAQTVATNDEQWAMWAVKTTVNGLTSSFGLVNDGSEPLFVIKGAKFGIVTSQDPNDVTPVFGVSGGKTVISNALIDEAYIKQLVVDDLLANLITVGSQFNSPSINYDPINGTRSNNFSIDPGGNMEATSATLDYAILNSVTIKAPDGSVVLAASGELDGAWIKNLSVDTLAIASNAVSAASSFSVSSASIAKNGTSTRSSSYINHSGGVAASVIVTLIISCKRTSGGGADDKINVTGSVKTASGTLASETVTVGIPGDMESYHFVPFSFKVSTSDSISMSFTGASLGESWVLSGKGAIHSAKR